MCEEEFYNLIQILNKENKNVLITLNTNYVGFIEITYKFVETLTHFKYVERLGRNTITHMTEKEYRKHAKETIDYSKNLLGIGDKR